MKIGVIADTYHWAIIVDKLSGIAFLLEGIKKKDTFQIKKVLDRGGRTDVDDYSLYYFEGSRLYEGKFMTFEKKTLFRSKPKKNIKTIDLTDSDILFSNETAAKIYFELKYKFY